MRSWSAPTPPIWTCCSASGRMPRSCSTRTRPLPAPRVLALCDADTELERPFRPGRSCLGTTRGAPPWPCPRPATAAGGDMLVVPGTGAEEVAKLVMAAAKALGGGEALEPALDLDGVDAPR